MPAVRRLCTQYACKDRAVLVQLLPMLLRYQSRARLWVLLLGCVGFHLRGMVTRRAGKLALRAGRSILCQSKSKGLGGSAA